MRMRKLPWFIAASFLLQVQVHWVLTAGDSAELHSRHPESTIEEEGEGRRGYDSLLDHEVDCGAWADLGECEKNEPYMHAHCAESCYHQHIIRSAVLTGRPFLVHCESSVGAFTIELHPAWAPWGVERFLTLLGDTWFDDSPFFRAVPGFLVQFGASLSEEVQKRWEERPPIPDDAPQPLGGAFKRGMVAFAGSGEHSRTDQLFIAFSDSGGDDEALGSEPWETPIGVVAEGMERLDRMAMYGDFPAFGGNGPDPAMLKGPAAKHYLETHFKDMDYIRFCHADLPVDAHGEEVKGHEL